MGIYHLLHIHTDIKFIHDTLRYVNNDFKNFIIYLGDENEQIKGKLSNIGIPFLIIPKQLSALNEIKDLSDDYDGVVLYDLCRFKTLLLDKISGKKIFLRLFGYELYSKVMHRYISKTTLHFANPITLRKYSLKNYVKRKIKRLFNKEFNFDSEKQIELYKKINAILLVNKYEYNELNKYFYLPPFIQIGLNRKTEASPYKKENKIIIGNSRHKWNNHLDILNILNPVKKTEFTYLFFFNYGSENPYNQKVKAEASKNKNCILIEDFLSIEDFENIYKTAAALVINSYRQHALGNIFTGILSGCKIYLNKKNSTYQWLKTEGFLINTINQLKSDLKKNDLYLTPEQQVFNMNKYRELQQSYTNADFINNIKTVLNE